MTIISISSSIMSMNFAIFYDCDVQLAVLLRYALSELLSL